MALQTAEEVLASIPKPRNSHPKKKVAKEEIVVVCGSTKWTDRKLMKKTFAALTNVKFIITGTGRGAELLAVSVAKECKLGVIQVHPSPHLNSSATHIRNSMVFSFFKPTRVIAFHEDIANSHSSSLYLKLGHRKGIPCVLLDGKKPAKSKK